MAYEEKRAYLLDLLWFLQPSVLISPHFSCKPLIWLQNPVNTNATIQRLFCPQSRFESNSSLKTFLVPTLHQMSGAFCLKTGHPSSLEPSYVLHIHVLPNSWLTWDREPICLDCSLCCTWKRRPSLYLGSIQRTVFSHPVWLKPDKHTNVPQSAELQRPVTVQWNKGDLCWND